MTGADKTLTKSSGLKRKVEYGRSELRNYKSCFREHWALRLFAVPLHSLLSYEISLLCGRYASVPQNKLRLRLHNSKNFRANKTHFMYVSHLLYICWVSGSKSVATGYPHPSFSFVQSTSASSGTQSPGHMGTLSKSFPFQMLRQSPLRQRFRGECA